jgi:UDP-2-acetamido-3-amino-2,3-dideoxy-glucuronate N-acetyltransferase
VRLTGRCEVETMAAARVEGSADVDPRAELGEGTVVWHLAQVREGARLGRDCIVGRGAYVGAGVDVGDAVKIQNHALVYEPASVGDGAFIGPAVVLTNDRYPRSITPDGARKDASGWEAEGVHVGRGAALGARSVVVAGVTVGEWATVAAGAVVTRDVPPHALVVGVPARQVGWVGRSGRPLEPEDEAGAVLTCPDTGERYRVVDGSLEELT